jgi:hypothetical protein
VIAGSKNDCSIVLLKAGVPAAPVSWTVTVVSRFEKIPPPPRCTKRSGLTMNPSSNSSGTLSLSLTFTVPAPAGTVPAKEKDVVTSRSLPNSIPLVTPNVVGIGMPLAAIGSGNAAVPRKPRLPCGPGVLMARVLTIMPPPNVSSETRFVPLPSLPRLEAPPTKLKKKFGMKVEAPFTPLGCM